MLYGTKKTIDYAGRIVLPREYRTKMGLEPGTEVILHEEKGKLTIEALSPKCKICECDEIVDDELPLCRACLEKAKSFNK